ncbi:hypothetical protein Poli38472_011575 [Pythium oligandrum]|uniref:Casein kinase I n=1 Tax=Pythium oligandrum TaxID=41045 RepID=A0A8K1FI77_PYTOL|nr:hypothetical protein Poli38472_011575 [Pythium oligandrum]|eukprot:TMW64695.1 hypothetical protein Poli38472_011575 [Pythium oligandrum]
MSVRTDTMEALNKNILLAGEMIAGKWKVFEKIGEGTFSQIYSAFDPQKSAERVAIKVEAPSSLKPVLEWESTILKNLQKCPYVCRYYYHGKHGESTVLVMELLGDSMSMLRVSPDALHGVPVTKCMSVGLEMLDCIEAFHRHGYVHRDIKASNFALSDPKAGPSKQRYLLIDFGLSRQHMVDGKVLPARPTAEFRGTSMYASLSAHRRQELGPKDDLWSWFYLVLDFMRGELPWAADAQQKNRQTVFSLKEYYTEKHPDLLVDGLSGVSHLLAIMKYLQSLQYEDQPDYDLLRDRLRRVATGSSEEDTVEQWDALSSDRERALQWTMRAMDAMKKSAEQSVLEALHTVAKKYNTFFDCEGLGAEEMMAVQEAVFEVESKIRVSTPRLAPPPIQSFQRRQQSELKLRSDALKKRREREHHIRMTIEKKLRRISSGITGSPANDLASGGNTPRKVFEPPANPVEKSDSSMDLSDGEVEQDQKMETPQPTPPSQNAPLPPWPRIPPPVPPSGPRAVDVISRGTMKPEG